MAKNNLPPIYTYPPYQEAPVNASYPTMAYPPPVPPGADYVYYPVDQFGNIVGPPVDQPPVDYLSGNIVGPPIEPPPVNYQYYPYWDYRLNAPTRDSYRRSPRIVYDNPNYHHPPLSRRSQYGSLPSIPKHPLVSTRILSPNAEEFQGFNVTDLTERDSTASPISSREALRKIKYYDKLQQTYR